jgi:hypothetical protein
VCPADSRKTLVAALSCGGQPRPAPVLVDGMVSASAER